MSVNISEILQLAFNDARNQLYYIPQTGNKQEFDQSTDEIQKTRKEFDGDLTIVVFPLTKLSRKSPEKTAEEIGAKMQELIPGVISRYTVIKGFLNIVVSDILWFDFIDSVVTDKNFGFHSKRDTEPYIVEFSSPNTNKPLHLGHIRNNLLGWSLSKIIEANGYPVVKTNLVNDRGIHICKSMLAWKKWGMGETPESSGMKGDHLVGKYYVLFDQHYKKEMNDLITEGMNEDDALQKAPLIKEAREMLKLWEADDRDVKELWSKMNGWVYKGFEETYQRLGISFDKVYYESQTYLLGKDMVSKGLEENKLYRKEDSSVWVDLRDEGLDEKVLLRTDGTSVYITQDLGTARLRYDEYHPQIMIYVVGNEQNYHFEVLEKVMRKLGYKWADSIYHLSYGMVGLPEGKMKSREGTVVDADDLLDEMFLTAKQTTEELGKSDGLSAEESEKLYQMIGLGALKYFILKVDPKKNMLFNPKESIDFNGNTGPFIQYTHARIHSLLKKAGETDLSAPLNRDLDVLAEEREIIRLCYEFPATVRQAGEEYSPALIANYIFELAQNYNTFYQKVPVLKEENPAVVYFRLKISALAGNIIKKAMGLLGIEVPDRM